MRYTAETLVWVRCDDGVWWPARVRETDEEMRAFLSADEDGCVEFFHHPGELYPVRSTDESRVTAFHAEPDARTAEEAEWFAHPEVAAAAARAIREHARRSAVAPPQGLLPRAATTSAAASGNAAPFSAAELRNIHSLLGAVQPATAALLRQQLRDASVSVATTNSQRQAKRERTTRKRERAAHAPPPKIVSAPLQRQRTEVATPAPPPLTATASASSSSSPASPASSAAPHSEGSDCSSKGTLPFVPAARRRVLELLRHEVFENCSRFVLSPIYRFIEVMGAVTVENHSLTTVLPLRRAMRETPTDGPSPQHRVLLVPLTEDYDHTIGWMVPTVLDDVTLSMSLLVNDTVVAVPPNWQLSPAKEASAVKTAVSVDVTDLVLDSTKDLFSLHVVFSGDVEEMEMWRGIIACVFVEEVGLHRLGERIVAHYRKPPTNASLRRSPSHSRSDRSAVDITEASVKLQCPITTLTMEIPVRSVLCEHLQCMELAAVLVQCARQNVWNCPLCSAAMKPEHICVNYRLLGWIASHPQLLRRVEYVVETAPESPLKVVYRQEITHSECNVEVVDDDD